MTTEHDHRPAGTKRRDDLIFVVKLDDIVNVAATDFARELHHFADQSQQVLPHSEDCLVDLLIRKLTAERLTDILKRDVVAGQFLRQHATHQSRQ